MIGGQHFAGDQRRLIAVQRADLAAGLGDQQRPGGHVPRLKPAFPIAIHLTRGHHGEVERAGPQTTDTRRALHDLMQFFQGLRVAGLADKRQTRGDQAVFHHLARRDAQAAVVVVGTLALFGPVEVVGDRVIGHTGNDLAIAFQRHRAGKHRDAVHEVGGAVDGIDDPAVRLIRAFAQALFFPQKTVAGAQAGQFLEQGGFDALVGGGDEVAGAFARHLKLADFAEVAGHALARLADGGDHGLNEGGLDYHIRAF